MNNKVLLVSNAVILTLVVGVSFAETDHNYYPRTAIDPSLGVAGDFSGTYQYWKDEAAIIKNSALANDKQQAWKLNQKHLDVAESDEIHPGEIAVDDGKVLVDIWEYREPGFINCLSSGSGKLDGIGAHYPQYDKELKRVINLEGRVEYCATKTLFQNFKQGTSENAEITSYIKSLSNGQPIDIDISNGPMKAAYERGEDLFYKRVGQLNFACASCHTPDSVMGNQLRGEVPTSPFGDVAHFPTYRSPAGDVEVLHKRFMRCQKMMRAKPTPPGDPAYVDLEVFYTTLSNGYPIKVPSIR